MQQTNPGSTQWMVASWFGESPGSLISMARSGAMAAYRRRGGVELTRLADRERRLIDLAVPARFGFGAGGLWLLAGGVLHRMSESGASVAECFTGEGSGSPGSFEVARGSHPACVVDGQLVELYDGALFVTPLELAAGERAICVGPRRLVIGSPERMRVVHLDRGGAWTHLPLGAGELRAATSLFGGTAMAVALSGPHPEIWVVLPDGELRAVIPIPSPDHIAFAEDRGIAVVGNESFLCAFDLRDGHSRYYARPPFPVDALDICARGRELCLAQKIGDSTRTWHASFADVFREM